MHAGMADLSTNSPDTATTTNPGTIINISTTTIDAASTPTKALAAITVATNLQQRSETPKTQRGQNKPKCVKCGNVARSRCPFHSCKSCCSKAQNPCHIHVLKSNGNLLEKTPSMSSPLSHQQSTEVPPAGTPRRVASFRQLSNTFAQFNNLQMPVRSRKPLTRKDATAINEWKFLKLKEYKDSNVELEDEAFDRYMQNINLLQEVFCVRNEAPADGGFLTSDPNVTNSVEDSAMVREMKLKLRTNPRRSALFRNRIQEIVHQGLVKLKKCDLNNDANGIHNQNEAVGRSKRAKTWKSEWNSVLKDLVDKLNKARNEEDLKSCLKIKSELFKNHACAGEAESEDVDMSGEQIQKNDLVPGQQFRYSPPKLLRSTEIDQEILNGIDMHFNSLEQIEDL